MSDGRLVTIDCEYVLPEFAAAYLRVQGGEAAFIETNTTHAVPKLLSALAAEGRDPADVRYVIVTHVHLDHAGGASALMRACPNATLLAQPRAVRHRVDPSKLVASAKAVYGEEAFDALYGRIEPIDEARVRALDDGASVPFGRDELSFWHTRGHANHHFVVHDPAADTVFTGDTFGLVYPRLQRARPFAIPSTSPTDFDAEAALVSLDRILGLGTTTAALTHFGVVRALPEIAADLRVWLELSGELVERAATLDPSSVEALFRERLSEELERHASRAGLVLDAGDRALLDLDLRLNAQGLAVRVGRVRSG